MSRARVVPLTTNLHSMRRQHYLLEVQIRYNYIKIKNVVAPTAHAIKRSSLVLRAKLPSLVAVRSRTRIGHYKQLDSTCEAWTIRRRCFERQYLGP